MLKYSNFAIVGIDVSSEFHIASAIAPDGSKLFSNFRFNNLPDDINSFVQKINELKLSYPEIVCGIESTGSFHSTLLKSINSSNIETVLINPSITNNTRKKTVRKVKNDKFDSFGIINAIKTQEFLPSYVPTQHILELRQFVRDYYSFTDSAVKYKLKLKSLLNNYWIGYLNVFGSPYSVTSLALLAKYPSPSSILNAKKSSIIKILMFARKGPSYANSTYDALIKSCKDSLSVFPNSNYDTSILFYVDTISKLEASANMLEQHVIQFVNSDACDSQFRINYNLLLSIPAVGDFTAIAILAELGNFYNFKSAKSIIAYFGMDPKIVQSGKFAANGLRITKAGSSVARRAIFSIAIRSVSSTRNGKLINPILREDYLAKCKSKAKLVALGHIMHKVVKIIFSVLKNQKKFKLITKDEHIKLFKLTKSA